MFDRATCLHTRNLLIYGTTSVMILEKLINYRRTTKSSELAERESVIKGKEEVINSKDDSIREMKQRLEEAPEDVSVRIYVTQNVLALEKTKSELAALKEKCRKLIVKVKQQEDYMKGMETEVQNNETFI